MKIIAKLKKIFFKGSTPFYRIFLEAFAIVMFWYGSWGLMEKYLFPDNPTLSYCTAILIGLTILFIDDASISEMHPGR